MPFDEVNAAVRPRVAVRRKGTLTKTSPVLSARGTVDQSLNIKHLGSPASNFCSVPVWLKHLRRGGAL